MSDRFSNGDDNPVELIVENQYKFNSDITIVDEIPPIFQRRDLSWDMKIDAGKVNKLKYVIKKIKSNDGHEDYGLSPER